MPDYFLENGERLRLRPDDAVGKGGEADIFKDGGFAIKIFKPPTHADFAGTRPEDIAARAAAKERIAEHQKKLRDFPRGLPARVVSPRDLVLDAKGNIAGYRMELVSGEVLYLYGEKSFRDTGIPDDFVVETLVDLHKTVEEAHRHSSHFVISDFNDLNVLIKDRKAWIIDADSGGFGPYLSRTFTMKFVDPLNCDPNAKTPTLVRPHTANSDWYAFNVMLMQNLLLVGPYGGVHNPKDPKKRIPYDGRSLKRVTIFNPEVKCPKSSRPYHILPDTLLEHFRRTFEKDERGIPPRALIENLRFTTCTKCGAVHARTSCPSCTTITPPMHKEIHTGGVSAFKEFYTDGVILYAVLEGDTIRYLYHDNGSYKRESGATIIAGALDAQLRYRISGTKTLLGRADQTVQFDAGGTQRLSTDVRGLLPIFDANSTNVFFARGGGLWRVGKLGFDYAERWGDVLNSQTLFWVGEKHGFGFYRAGEISVFFAFDTNHPGLNDSVTLPPIRGQLVDATCCFGSDRIWFFVATSEGGKTINRCHVLDGNGVYLGSHETTAGDGSWLGSIRGKCAAGGLLLSATDDGVVRVELGGTQLNVVKEFPATAQFVDTDSRIFLGNKGLYVAGKHDIWRLVLK